MRRSLPSATEEKDEDCCEEKILRERSGMIDIIYVTATTNDEQDAGNREIRSIRL